MFMFVLTPFMTSRDLRNRAMQSFRRAAPLAS